MRTEIFVQIIAIIGCLIVASYTYYLSKKRETEHAWRKKRLDFYINFINNLSGITDNEWSKENVKKFAKSCNDLYLFANHKVINKMQDFLNETSESNNNINPDQYTIKLTNLIYEMRKDIKTSNKNDNFKVFLRTGTKK